ncbi:hypothetical protein KAU19_01285 [Candidatus Parcubacteria bacterium]|nr:hypothetical protein [Candidatus Parcubacteria bacterium]
MNLQENFSPNKSMSAVEIEGGNFIHFVINALQKKKAYNLIGLIEQGKINLELDKKRIIEAGNAAEKIADQKEEEFNSTEHFIKRCEALADELIKNQKNNN